MFDALSDALPECLEFVSLDRLFFSNDLFEISSGQSRSKIGRLKYIKWLKPIIFQVEMIRLFLIAAVYKNDPGGTNKRNARESTRAASFVRPSNTRCMGI